MLPTALLTTVLLASTIPGFDRVLLPMHNGNTQGTGGTTWKVDEVIYNQSDEPAVFYPYFSTISSFTAQLSTVAPHRTLTPSDIDQVYVLCRTCPPPRPPHPSAILYVQSEHRDRFVIYDRVHEQQFDADNRGAVVPSVHESQFRRGRTSFPTVPIGDNFRSTLRLYNLGDTPITATVRLMQRSSLLAESSVVIPAMGDTIRQGPHLVPLRPGYSQLTVESLLSSTPGESVDVVIDSDPANEYWAFLSVTSNSAQRVTVFVPSP